MSQARSIFLSQNCLLSSPRERQSLEKDNEMMIWGRLCTFAIDGVVELSREISFLDSYSEHVQASSLPSHCVLVYFYKVE